MPRERRRKHASGSTNNDDEDSRSPGPPPKQKKSRAQKQTSKNPTPAPNEVEQQEGENSRPAEDRLEDLLNMVIPDPPEPTMSTDPDAPRLIITKIEVENFKSYFGKQTLGPFHKNFTAILGPNGSGKSNVIDSLLFVFGFRASKVRSKKIAHLIHNSSAHPNVKSCTVIVYFAKIVDKGTVHEIQPNTQFNISRTANKSGTSNYYINGRHSSTNDVRDKLKSNGIDLDHNRFLILQGEVEQISLMKPKRNERSEEDGMLEYLEDIIGSTRLKVPIEKFRKRMELYDNDQEMIQKRFKLAETEVSQLVEPVREVIRLLKVENAITKNKHKLFSIEKNNYATKSNEAKELFDQLKQQHSSTDEDLRKCGAEIKKQNKKKNELIEEESSLKDKIDDTEKRKTDAEIEQRKNTEKIAQIESRKAKKESEIKKERKKLAEAEEAPSRAQNAIKEHQDTIENLQKEIAECESLIKELGVKEREANEANRTELAEIMPQITSLSTEENKFDEQIALAKDRLERAENSANDPQIQLENAEQRVKDCQVRLADSETQNVDLETQIPQLQNEIRAQEEKSQNQRARETELVDRINTLQREIQASRNEMSSNNSNNAALTGLMNEKRNGNIEGIFGRLGDLGGIDPHYDVAISTCCSQLENVVVDNVTTAQKCIDFLKRNNLARITFIALDKQQKWWKPINEKPQTPENAPRLIDLITVADENVKPAFYSVLRDTLFAETIDDATRISFQPNMRWRVATARGEVVEPSGTMSGGGNREIKGRMGKQVRVDTSQITTDRDWRRIEVEVRELREELSKLRMELSQTMDRIKSLKENYRRLEHEQRILKKNIPELKRQFENARKEVVDAKKVVQETTVDENEINQLKAKISKAEQDKNDVNTRASSLRQQKNKIDTKIKKIENNILGRSRDKLNQLKQELKEAESDCKKEKLTLKNSSTTIERIKRNIECAEEAIRAAHDELVKANQDINKLKVNYDLYVGRKTEYETRLQETVTSIQETINLLEELQQQEIQFQHLLDAQNRELRTAENQMKANLEKLEEVEAAIGKLMLYTIRSDLTLPEPRQPAASISFRGRRNQEDESIFEIPNNQTVTNVEMDDDQAQSTATNAEEESNQEMPEEAESAEPNEANNNEAIDEQAEAEANATLAMEVDEQTDDLPNTTALTTPNGDITHNPIYDQGTLPIFTAEEIQEFSRDQIRKQLESHEKLKAKFKIKLNLQLLDDYAEKFYRRNEVLIEMESLKDVINKHRKKLNELSQRRNDEFNEGFQKICLATQEIYQMITLGGDAMLEKVNAMDTFTEGITFQVRPPKKTWKQITNLSGGEKTLASLALVFGLHTFRPTPLYVMDEIDAALDYRNVSIISTYLKERTKNAQFIIISLRNNMFENGDRLLGIYKVNDCTQNVIYDTENFGDSSDDEN